MEMELDVDTSSGMCWTMIEIKFLYGLKIGSLRSDVVGVFGV